MGTHFSQLLSSNCIGVVLYIYIFPLSIFNLSTSSFDLTFKIYLKCDLLSLKSKVPLPLPWPLVAIFLPLPSLISSQWNSSRFTELKQAMPLLGFNPPSIQIQSQLLPGILTWSASPLLLWLYLLSDCPTPCHLTALGNKSQSQGYSCLILLPQYPHHKHSPPEAPRLMPKGNWSSIVNLCPQFLTTDSKFTESCTRHWDPRC